MTKLQILIIGTTDILGGAAHISWALGETLRQRGYSVHYLVSRKYSSSKYVEALDSSNFHKISMFWRYFWTFFTSNDLDYGHNADILDHPWYKSTDIVHLHNLHGNFFNLNTLVQMCKDKKVVWTLHDLWAVLPDVPFLKRKSPFSYPPMIYPNKKSLLMKKNEIYKNSNFVVVSPSQYMTSKIKSSGMLTYHNIVTILNGVDISAIENQNNQIKNKSDFIFVGNPSDPRKGFSFIKKAFYKIHGYSLKILNNCSHADVIDSMKASKAILIPSLEESFCLTAVEAVACGLPIVGFGVGIIPEIVVHKENGYIAKYSDIEDFKNGIKWATNLSNEQRSKLIKRNQNFVSEEYSIEKMVSEYEALFKQL